MKKTVWVWVLAFFAVVNALSHQWGWVIFDLLFITSFVLRVPTRNEDPR